MTDRAKCAILVPANYGIEPECEHGLLQLERRGYPVWWVPGFANIDQCRNELATDALARGFEELFWIDADIAFDPDDVDRLRGHLLGSAPSPQPSPIEGEGEEAPSPRPSPRKGEGEIKPAIVSGIYPKKGQRALASRLLPETKEIVFGAGGGLIEILYAATGFLLTRREVYETIRSHCQLPTCNEHWGRPTVPYFMPMVVEEEAPSPRPSPAKGEGEGKMPEVGSRKSGDGTAWPTAAGGQEPPPSAKQWHDTSSPLTRRQAYLGDDFAFCHRARLAGYKIYADTTIRLGHIGRYAFSWEEAGGSNQRFGKYIYRVLDCGSAGPS